MLLALWFFSCTYATLAPTPLAHAPALDVTLLNHGFIVRMNNTLPILATWFCAATNSHLTVEGLEACSNDEECESRYGGDIARVGIGATVEVNFKWSFNSSTLVALDCIFINFDNADPWFSDIGRMDVRTLPMCSDGNDCPEQCVDSADSTEYRCSPSYDGGFKVNGQGVCGDGVNHATLTTVNGTDSLSWCMKLGLHSTLADFSRVEAWVGGIPGAWHNCLPLTIEAVGTTHLRFSCKPPPGMGHLTISTEGNLVYDWFEVWTAVGSGYSYPDTVIVPNSIRTLTNSTRRDAVHAPEFDGMIVQFDVQNLLVPFKWPWGMFYGTEDDPERYWCDFNEQYSQLVALAASNTTFLASTFACLTDYSEYDAEPYRFQLSIRNATVRGSDTYDLPSNFPRITSITATGCLNNTAEGSVYDCPTKGSTQDSLVLITIFGYNFQPWRNTTIGVVVGSARCATVAAMWLGNELEQIICRLPQGTGANQAVYVRTGTNLSPSRLLVSYLAPTVHGLCGCDVACTASGSNMSPAIGNCPRQGGVTIQVFGANFGESKADVLIGGEVCTNVIHDAANPHGHLRCTLPPGALLSRNILVIQYNGANSARTSEASLSYLQCAPGTFQDGAETACANCSLGTFSALSGQTRCTDCEPGTIGVSVGRSSCIACEIGKYQYLSNATSCLACAAGRFAPSLGTSFCALCQPGKRGPNITANETTLGCIDCPVGTFQDAAGELRCIACEAGRFNSETGKTSCRDCPAATVSEAGQVTCSPCPLGSIVTDKSCACKPESYLAKDGDVLYCAGCVHGMKCNGVGVTVQNALASPGFIRVVEGAVLFQACLFPSYCPGDGVTCAPYRRGPLCNLCEPGYRPVTGQSYCELCPDTSVALGNVIGVFVGLLAALVVVYVLVVRSDMAILQELATSKTLQPKKPHWWTRTSSSLDIDRSSTAASTVGPQDEIDGESYLTTHQTRPEKRIKRSVSYQFKIVITYLQLITALTAFDQVAWPPTFVAFVTAFDFVNLNFLPWNYVGCLSEFTLFTKIIFTSCIPIALLALFGLPLLALLWIMEHRDLADSDHGRIKRVERRAMFLRVIVFTVFLCYPVVSRQIAAYFRCEGVYSDAQTTVYYLKDSFSERCYDDAWFANLGYVVVLALLYPLMVPLGLFLVLRRFRPRFREPFIRFGLGLAFLGFYEQFWWLEVLDMTHKLMLGSIIGLIPGSAQWVVGLLVASAYALTLLLLFPYIRDADNRLHLLAQVNIFLLILSLAIGEYETIEAGSLADVFISLLLIAIVCTVFCYFLLRVFVHLKSNSHAVRRLLRRKQEQMSPQLGRQVSGLPQADDSTRNDSRAE